MLHFSIIIFPVLFSNCCSSTFIYVLLLLQSALQPLWGLTWSTIVEYSQQEGFYRVPLPAARQDPNLEDQWLERSNSRHQVSPHVWNDASEPQQRKVELWARNLSRILPKVATSTSLLGSFTCRKFMTWDRRLYFPSEDFFRPKNPTASAGFEPAKLAKAKGQHAYL